MVHAFFPEGLILIENRKDAFLQLDIVDKIWLSIFFHFIGEILV